MEKQNSRSQQIETCGQLRSDIETALKKKLQTPKDFDLLSERIYARLHVLISRTTLMRMWGYVDENVKPRKGTLDILSQFLGYQDWDGYCQNSLLPKEQQSSPVMARRLSVGKELERGDMLRLTWHPDRVCDVEYQGNLQFRVVASENTRLRADDTFLCSLIIEGEPLYLDNLKQGVHPPVAYVCGKHSGVWFERK